MVLSLVNLSLISITDGMKNGTIQNPHMLPPILRQMVLDTALKRRLVDNPQCLALLTSIDFLNGMKSISIQINSYISDFSRRLTESITATLPNGETVDAAITKLDFVDFGCSFWDNRIWKPVLENVVEFCLRPTYTRATFLGNGIPFINFKQLTKLKLDYCCLDINLWPEFLRRNPTLEYLQMIDVATVDGIPQQDILDKFLPISMPRLKSVEIMGNNWNHFNCNKAFVDNLMGRPELRHVHLTLDKSLTDDESLIRLDTMVADRGIAMKIKGLFNITGYGNINSAAFDSSSKLKVVRIFHEKVDSIYLSFFYEWKPSFSIALKDVVTTCLNLTSFSIICDCGPVSREEMKPINAALLRFFTSSERAVQLKDLLLDGNFDKAVISAVFERCPNLVYLNITSCPALRDQHLIDWVSRDSGKLTEFILAKCQNVTSEGIIPILARSAEELLRYRILVGEPSGGRNWKTVLKNLCPYARVESRCYVERLVR